MPSYDSKDAFIRTTIETALDAIDGITKVQHMSAKDAAAANFGAFWYYVHIPRDAVDPYGGVSGGGINESLSCEVDIYIGGRAGDDPQRTGRTHTVGAAGLQQVYEALLGLPRGGSADIGVTTVRLDGIDPREPVRAFDDSDPIWRGLIQCKARYTEFY